MVQTVDHFFSRARILCRQENFIAARELYNEFRAMFPNEMRLACRLKAIVEINSGNIDEAISIFETALDDTLEGIANRHTLLRLLVQKGELNKAIVHATQIIHHSNDINDRAFVASAASFAIWCLCEKNQFEQAEKYLSFLSDVEDSEVVARVPHITVRDVRMKLDRR
jgi:tetratricopeptide (TPR) repeat protein